MAIFHHKWLILWRKKNYFHQYPVANGFWSTFDPIRISGSTPTCGLLLSSTSPLKQTSSFPNSRDYVTFKIPNLQQIWQNAVEGSDARSDHDT